MADSYGIQVRNGSGKVIFDTSTITWNYLGHFIAPANETGSLSIPELSQVTQTLVQKAHVDTMPNNQQAIVHNVAISGNVVSATGGKVRTLVVVMGR